MKKNMSKDKTVKYIIFKFEYGYFISQKYNLIA